MGSIYFPNVQMLEASFQNSRVAVGEHLGGGARAGEIDGPVDEKQAWVPCRSLTSTHTYVHMFSQWEHMGK